MSALQSIAIDRFSLPHPSGTRNSEISVYRTEAIAADTSAVPVLYVLDGDAEFAMAAEIVRFLSTNGTPLPLVVVGIGYMVPHDEFLRLRTADLTPRPQQPHEKTPEWIADITGDQGGGAAAYLDFLETRLSAEVAARYPETQGGTRHIFGHSLGGLFTAYALLTRPASFDTFMVASPALWWEGFDILSRLPDFSGILSRSGAQPAAIVTIGSKEQDVPTETPVGYEMDLSALQALIASCRMVDAAREFAEALRAAGLDRVTHVRFEGDDHIGVVPASMVRGINHILATTRRIPI